jgi:hypothetical protein
MRNLIIEDIKNMVSKRDAVYYKNTTLFFTTAPNVHDGLPTLEVIKDSLWDKFSDEDLFQAYKMICERFFSRW